MMKIHLAQDHTHAEPHHVSRPLPCRRTDHLYLGSDEQETLDTRHGLPGVNEIILRKPPSGPQRCSFSPPKAPWALLRPEPYPQPTKGETLT